MNKPRFYIAAPFFNSAQTRIVEWIESQLRTAKFDFYSPRLHSGSAEMTPESRKIRSSWMPVLDSNIQMLHKCDIVLAVVEYAMPMNVHLCISKHTYVDRGDTENVAAWKERGCDNPNTYLHVKDLELPDNGVVFECGFAYAIGKPIVGFHSIKQLSELNLMLSHTLNGMITGFDNLAGYLSGVVDAVTGQQDQWLNNYYIGQVTSEVL